MYHRYEKSSGRPNRSNRHSTTLYQLAIFILVIACISLFIAYRNASNTSANTRAMLVSRMQKEATDAKARAYELTQSGGSKLDALVAVVRQHVYAMKTINDITAGIYGPGNVLVNETSINNCIVYLDESDKKNQTGAVRTGTFTSLREAIDQVVLLLAEQ